MVSVGFFMFGDRLIVMEVACGKGHIVFKDLLYAFIMDCPHLLKFGHSILIVMFLNK